MANEQKKYVTFISMVNANKKNGTFIAATVGSLISKFRIREVNGKKLITACMPIQNRAKYINTMLGTSFSEESEESIWVDVTFWEKRADRFENMLAKLDNPDKIRVVLVGSLSAKKYTKKDNSGEGIAVTLSVSDWMLVDIPKSAKKGTAISGNINSSAPANADNAQDSDFSEEMYNADELVDFDGSEDDLPF